MIDIAIHTTYQLFSTSNYECSCSMHKLLFLLDVHGFLVHGICKGLVTGFANSHATFHMQLHHLYAISKTSSSIGWGDWQALNHNFSTSEPPGTETSELTTPWLDLDVSPKAFSQEGDLVQYHIVRRYLSGWSLVILARISLLL